MIERHSISREDEIAEIKNDVRSIRGLGDSGERIVVVEFGNTDLEHGAGYQLRGCPGCGYDRCKVTHNVNPTMATPLHYECMNPECGWNETEELPEELQ